MNEDTLNLLEPSGGSEPKKLMPDWIKLAISTLIFVGSGIWYAGAQQALINHRLDTLEAKQEEIDIERAQVLDKLSSIQRSLVEIQTVLHYQSPDGKNEFPLPQENLR